VSVIQETWLVASAELLGDKMMDDNEEKENADQFGRNLRRPISYAPK
jgi:hypothetical protein